MNWVQDFCLHRIHEQTDAAESGLDPLIKVKRSQSFLFVICVVGKWEKMDMENCTAPLRNTGHILTHNIY